MHCPRALLVLQAARHAYPSDISMQVRVLVLVQLLLLGELALPQDLLLVLLLRELLRMLKLVLYGTHVEDRNVYMCMYSGRVS